MLVCCEICGCIFSDKDPVCPLCKHSTEFSRRVRAFGGTRMIPQVLFSVFIFLTASAITVGLVEYSKRFTRPTGRVILDLDGVKPARFTARAQTVPGTSLPPSGAPGAAQVTSAPVSSTPAASPAPTPSPAPVTPLREPEKQVDSAAIDAALPDTAAGAQGPRSSTLVATALKPQPARPSARVADRPRPGHLPEYELLHAAREYGSQKLYAEVLVPSLSPQSPVEERKQIMTEIAAFEGFESGTLYCTRQAREAHYSMDYADRHPQALSQGLLGTYEGGRFKPYKD